MVQLGILVQVLEDRIELAEVLAPAGGEDAGGELILGGVVAVGFVVQFREERPDLRNGPGLGRAAAGGGAPGFQASG